MKEYRKKPVVIQAMHYDGTRKCAHDIMAWLGEHGKLMIRHELGEHYLYIKTMEGEMHVSPGDYVIRGVQGEFYPCKPDIFKETYDEVEV